MEFRAAAAGRADKLVAQELAGRGRRAVAEAFAAGQVRVNGKRARKGDAVKAGNLVWVEDLPGPEALRPLPQPELPLAVLAVDDVMVVLDKPPGMPSCPLRPGELGTLANALVARHPECVEAGADAREAGLVHRLDTGTSGVLVAARSRVSWTALRDEFRSGRVVKEYLALVAGAVERGQEIDVPISHDRSGAGGVRVGNREGALPALTEVHPRERLGPYTLVACVARTGRMHQVRAHLAWAGYPVVDDARYGGPSMAGSGGPFLHAARLELPHPGTENRVAFEAPLPEGRRLILERLR